MKVLVIDVGGTHVKLKVSDGGEARQLESSAALTPDALVHDVLAATRDWEYEAVSLGYPGRVDERGPVEEPGNLGGGWVGFDFERGFGRSTRVINDAAMQALGGYDGGRMLFLGFGTGLGSTLVTERVIVPLELGALRDDGGRSLFDRLGRHALRRDGVDAWRHAVSEIVPTLRLAFVADYIVLGGGNASAIDPLPAGSRRGGNEDAFTGGFRLWEEPVEPHDRTPSRAWRVVR